jgi:hypothetical protein
MSAKLAHQTQKTAGIGNGMRTATVTAVSGRVVTLDVAGGQFSSGVGCLSTYVPAVGDVVAVFRQDSSWLILGAVGVSNGPQPRATQTGSVLVSMPTAIASNTVVAFDLPFTAPPKVTTNFESTTVFRIGTRAINITATGFTMYTYTTEATNQTWSNQPASYVATATS